METVKRELCSTDTPIADKMRCVFTLKGLGGEGAVDALIEGFRADPDPGSELLRHEVCYVLGQMQCPKAIPFLQSVLQNTRENSMVRHEAGEAIGAIGCRKSLRFLEQYVNDPSREVAETCILAIERINRVKDEQDVHENLDSIDKPLPSKFHSVDPAPSFGGAAASLSVKGLQQQLMDESAPLYDRYRAMFALRDISTTSSALALCTAFDKPCEGDSALFRHEIAYVLGQMQQSAAIPYLSRVLANAGEHDMVRHEAAEALGACIGIEDGESVTADVLHDHLKDSSRAVRESCAVALDIKDYFESDSFQYADGLSKDLHD